jgi:hypothetical protein
VLGVPDQNYSDCQFVRGGSPGLYSLGKLYQTLCNRKQGVHIIPTPFLHPVCCPGEYDPERVCLMKGSRPELGSRYSVCHARPLHCIRPLWRRVKRCLTGLSVSAPLEERRTATELSETHIITNAGGPSE